jgi:hypothetical protein
MEGYDTNYKAFGELIREGHTEQQTREKGGFNSHRMHPILNIFHCQLAETVLFYLCQGLIPEYFK